MKKPLIIIAGATACGKTGSSIHLAKKINAQIISADSMQVYKYMDIGTAKITEDEKQGIKHYLIDEFLPDEPFSISIFKNKAIQYINDIYNKDKIPILVGGTGFYINSVVYNNDFSNTNEDLSYRNSLYELEKQKGADYLHNMLEKIDYEASQKIHKNNVKKVIRALEYFKLTGEKISTHNEREKTKEKAFDTHFFILNMDRAMLYNRINKRVDIMIEQGLKDEVYTLLNKGYHSKLISMQGIGYKEMIAHINGEYSFDYTIELIKKNTRNFAKRQLTWFKHQAKDGIWIDVNNFDNANCIANYMENIYKGEINE